MFIPKSSPQNPSIEDIETAISIVCKYRDKLRLSKAKKNNYIQKNSHKINVKYY